MKIRFGIALSSCLVLIGFGLAAGQPAMAADEPSFVPSERPGIRISDSNIQFATGDAFSGDGEDDLGVLDPGGRTLRLFRNLDGKRLKLQSVAKFRTSVGGWDSGVDLNDFDPLRFGVTNPIENETSVLSIPTDDRGEFRSDTLASGSEPSDSTFLETFLGYRGIMVTNRGDDTVTVTSFGPSYRPGASATVPVGSQPVAVSSGGIGDDAMVANFGSDDVTILGPNFNPEGETLSPAYKVLQTLPVGDEPTDIYAEQYQGLDSGEIDFVVVNRGSDSVTTIGREDGGPYHVIAEYPVGSRPVSITPADLNHDGVYDFVVANSGSDDVSLLINGEEGLERGGRIKVGEKPVAVIAMGLNQYFSPDLVVANAGDGTITSLLWNETSATCNGRPSKLRKLTPDDDYNRGSSNPNSTHGLGGDDEIFGGQADDCLFGGDDNDLLNGGPDNDRLIGGPGRDELTGQNGSDLVRGGPGNDVLCEPFGIGQQCGGHAIGFFHKGPGDRLFGGPGNDRISAGTGPNRIDAGPGSDRIKARGNGFDRIDCGRGRDTVLADRKDRLTRCEVVRP